MLLPNLRMKLTVLLPFLAYFTAEKKRKIAVVQPEKQYVFVSAFSQNLGAELYRAVFTEDRKRGRLYQAVSSHLAQSQR